MARRIEEGDVIVRLLVREGNLPGLVAGQAGFTEVALEPVESEEGLYALRVRGFFDDFDKDGMEPVDASEGQVVTSPLREALRERLRHFAGGGWEAGADEIADDLVEAIRVLLEKYDADDDAIMGGFKPVEDHDAD